MKSIANIALGVAVGCAVGCIAASLFVHRRVIAAVIKGQEIPEPPAWHMLHPFCNKAE